MDTGNDLSMLTGDDVKAEPGLVYPALYPRGKVLVDGAEIYAGTIGPQDLAACLGSRVTIKEDVFAAGLEAMIAARHEGAAGQLRAALAAMGVEAAD